jgi:hypothetical protein
LPKDIKRRRENLGEERKEKKPRERRHALLSVSQFYSGDILSLRELLGLSK